MNFIADFHIHSKFSRATARDLDFENLYINAQIKGITVLGTADFTHPSWWQEIRDKLVPAEAGLFALKPDIARACDEKVPAPCRGPVRFMLVTEISNIYKKDDRTRKNHNLVFMPDMDSAARFNRKLDDIGNIQSDGRPILGLDARNLLEIVLEMDDDAYLVPAHIWTPWFSLLGSKSGFDTVEACFEDLTPHIFALETGLSSDPPMNWRVSGLDRYTLISNSDAHSPSKLGREANRFNCELTYGAIRSAMETADPDHFLGTIEFYPEEGKYHVDGHRKCGFQSAPSETRRLSGICPVCKKPLTLGVLYRVEALADRKAGERPANCSPYENLIPLKHVLSEVLQVGPNSKKVCSSYDRLIRDFGSEFEILCNILPESLNHANVPLLSEAVLRMREGRVNFTPGYDGEFGRVTIFDAEERASLQGQQPLFDMPEETPIGAPQPKNGAAGPVDKHQSNGPNTQSEIQPPLLFSEPQSRGIRLNAEQQAAVEHATGPLLISAGPGTGKTRTITCRIADLIEHRGVAPEHILAVTFTRKAAEEMQHRLRTLLSPDVELPMVSTFHGFSRHLIEDIYEEQTGAIIDNAGRSALLSDAMEMVRGSGRCVNQPQETHSARIISAKQRLYGPADDLSDIAPADEKAEFAAVYEQYQQLLEQQALFDFEDLIFHTVRMLEEDSGWKNELKKRFTHIFVDEFQDVNGAQYRLLRALAPPKANICVIGDPDQAIYGFRGADLRYFEKFSDDYHRVKSIRLKRNYRSTQIILDAACQVIQPRREHDAAEGPACGGTRSGIPGLPYVAVMETTSDRSEAVAIGRTIEQMIGGTGFHSMDFDKLDGEYNGPERSFGDFAVLCRTGDQVQAIARQLTDAGIPCQWVSRRFVEQPSVAKLLAAFRIVTHQGGYVDLNHLIDLGAVGISRETLGMFKQWAYARQLPVATALHSVHRLPIPRMSKARQQRLVSWVRLIERLQQACADLGAAAALIHIAANTTLSSKIDGEDLKRLTELAEPHGNDLWSFGVAMAIQRDTDLYNPDVEKVSVMTLHAAKGLEFPVVFIAGCEDKLLPLHRPGKNGEDLEEERRLFYVGMTRSRQRLILTWSKRRRIYGKTRSVQISPFVSRIDPALIRTIVSKKVPAKPRQEQLSLF